MLLHYHNRMGLPLYYSPPRDSRTSTNWLVPYPEHPSYGMMANFTEEMQLPTSPQNYNGFANESDEEGALFIATEEGRIDTEEEISVDDDGSETFVCRWNGCDKLFDSPDNLAQHVTSTHATASRGGQYYCCWDECPRTQRGFNARYKMLVHIRTHTKEKPHKCSMCGKKFSRAENLKIHSRSHSGERPYVCPVSGCNKAYSNSSDRFKHTRTHSTERPYVCKIPGCQKRYTDPSSLRKHVKTFKHHTTAETRERRDSDGNQRVPAMDDTRMPRVSAVEEHRNYDDERVESLKQEAISGKSLHHADASHPDESKVRNCNCSHECFEHMQRATEFLKIGALLNNFTGARSLLERDFMNSPEFTKLAWGGLWNPQDFIKNNIADESSIVNEQTSKYRLEGSLSKDSMEIDLPLDLTVHK